MDIREGQSDPSPEQLDPPGLLEALHERDTKLQALEPGIPDEPFNPTPEQQQEIEDKRKILSGLAYYIGKDFRIPVELNKPGEGWHWDFKANIIRVDPKDLLEKSMNYLRFVISHEGGHRRISRMAFIPLEVWRQPGFSFMTNAIEDPRDNNFVAATYPEFRKQMAEVYQEDLDFENKAKGDAKAKLGYQPRFIQAGFEYIKQWFRTKQGETFSVDEELPAEVKAVVEKTLPAAQNSWRKYPTREQANEGEAVIVRFAKASYETNRDEVWPDFQTLVEEDMKDQRMQEALQDMQQPGEPSKGGGQGLPQELKDKLTPQQQEELEKAIEEALEQAKQQGEGQDQSSPEQSGDGQSAPGEGEPGKGGKSHPIDLDSLSEELKQKIKEYIDGLPDDQKSALAERAAAALKEFEDQVNEALAGKFVEKPEQLAAEPPTEPGELQPPRPKPTVEPAPFIVDRDPEFRRRMEELFLESASPYMEALKDLSPLIDDLTGDLRNVFVKRKIGQFQPGHRFGRKWNVPKRIQEKIAGIRLLQTESREQRERPSEETDYAVTLLIDLSGSMRGDKIIEAFRAALVLAETLHNLNIRFEVVGFQDLLLEFKNFDADLDDGMREKLNQLLLEVTNKNPGGHNRAGDNNDGECLLVTSEHLKNQNARHKFLIVISDGQPAMDSGRKSHQKLAQELTAAVDHISTNTNQKLIGLGLLSSAVSDYYPNHLANIKTEEMVETLGEVLRASIEQS